MSNLYADCFRIAEEAHKGRDDEYIRELCGEASSKHEGVTAEDIYRRSEQIYCREFESR